MGSIIGIVLIAIIATVVLLTRGGGFDRDKVQSAWSAYTAVTSAIESSVAYGDYGKLVDDLATELDLLRTSTDLSDDESRFAGSLQLALDAYQRAREAWREHIDHGAVTEDVMQLAWYDADTQAAAAIALMTDVDESEYRDEALEREQDETTKYLIIAATAAVESAYIDMGTLDPAIITPALLTLIEPTVTFIPVDSAQAASVTPTANALDGSVNYFGASETYAVGSVSESGKTFGVAVTNPAAEDDWIFYAEGEIGGW